MAVPSYPNYVDLDPFIDVAGLKALDPYLRERLEKRIEREADIRFYTGPFVLKQDSPTVPGSKMVYLSRSSQEDNYYDLDRVELWKTSEEAEEFAELMGFIDTLPFK